MRIERKIRKSILLAKFFGIETLSALDEGDFEKAYKKCKETLSHIRYLK